MAYVDVMVTPVPKKKIKAYRALCKKSEALWKKHGAVEYAEWIEDDVKPGKVTSFPQSLNLKKGELVAVSYIVFKSKAHRTAIWKKVMKDPVMANVDWKKVPFDAARMYFGGFKPIVKF